MCLPARSAPIAPWQKAHADCIRPCNVQQKGPRGTIDAIPLRAMTMIDPAASWIETVATKGNVDSNKTSTPIPENAKVKNKSKFIESEFGKREF